MKKISRRCCCCCYERQRASQWSRLLCLPRHLPQARQIDKVAPSSCFHVREHRQQQSLLSFALARSTLFHDAAAAALSAIVNVSAFARRGFFERSVSTSSGCAGRHRSSLSLSRKKTEPPRSRPMGRQFRFALSRALEILLYK